MTTTITSVCFTGHRPPSIGGYNDNSMMREIKTWLNRVVYTLICSSKVERWITGGALGVDTWAANTVLHHGQNLHLYLPFSDMGANWIRLEDRAILNYHINKAQLVRHVSKEKYSPRHRHVYIDRDKAMVDNSDLVIGVWHGRKSGTGATMDYAMSQGKSIIRYNPQDRLETTYKGFEKLEEWAL